MALSVRLQSPLFGRRPLIAGRFEVVMVKEAIDIGNELRNTLEAAQPDDLSGDLPKEALYQVEPRS